LQRIALEVEALPEVASVRIWRSNVDYWTRQTWGCHENYLTKRAVGELAKDLVPFLVTRVVYAGAGGWNPNHYGLEFSLSPRLQLFTNTISGHTTSQRPIINTRDESHSGEGYHRVHLICRDSLHSQLGDLLSIGITRLVVRLADLGLNPGRHVQIAHPVRVLHTICADPACAAEIKTTGGERLTAIDIQRRYLDEVRTHADRLPDWSLEVADLLEDVLDRLQTDPRSLAGELDWPTKLVLFEARSDTNQITSWNRAVATLGEVTSDGPRPLTLRPRFLRDLVTQGHINQEKRDAVEAAIKSSGGWAGVRKLDTIKHEVLKADVLFGDYAQRLFDRFAHGKPFRACLPAAVAQAMTHPPHNTRAAVRGRLITEMAGTDECYCDWAWVRAPDRTMRLDDPFQLVESEWQPHGDGDPQRENLDIPSFLRIRQMARDARARRER
ncbi:MAG: proteasome accessory factor PafA2 family protein, partial [Gammaproteobacteria bacterium]|nr:proteasome accessory factor PafA2 family protein [Gammaproteobacteria bacterium]